MIMFNNILNVLFGERSVVTSECQVNDTSPDTKAKDGVKNNANDGSLSDFERLEKHYGELHEGKVIQTSLQEILAVIPRKRARTDAYGTLVRQLERDYKIKLIITSRKHSKTRNQ